eukprot:2505377-Rhodomonas_salina.3
MELGLGEGLLQRQKAAENVVHLAATAETEDHQDHTFAVHQPSPHVLQEMRLDESGGLLAFLAIIMKAILDA